ncbi:PAS domain S-box protein [Polyangium aurulentum]|uniref:PAS domain S-box protein n=1 Tax=Polyangium aurulentum TaxID=2567896 RepID=UPI00146D3CA0|nr:PAS domain S-box protein [Polyangium aurulentum]UQA62753.1 PAS domain S-box protein [Polyangium aurulentum]
MASGVARLHLTLPNGPMRSLIGVAVAFMSTAAVLGMRLSLDDLLSGNAPLLAFVLAVAVTAIIAGFWPGLLATALSALAGTYFFLEPTWGVDGTAQAVRLVLFLLVGLLISSLSASLHRALAQSRADHEALALSEAELRSTLAQLEARVARRTAELERQVRERETVEAELRRAKDGLERRVAERTAELESLLSRFRATFENAAVGIAHLALDGRWLFVNQKLCDILEYSREELVGRPFDEPSHPDDRAQIRAELERMKSGETSGFALEKRYFRKDGQLVWVNLTAAMQRDADGRPELVIAVIEDISGRKQASATARVAREEKARSLVQLEAIVSSMTEGLMVFDAEAKIVTMNPSAVTILGFESEEELRSSSARGANLFEVWDLAGQPIPLEQWPISRVVAGETFSTIEVRVRRKDNGASRILSYGGRPVRDENGKVVLAVTTFRDVTAQRRAEEEREMLLESERAARAEAERASRVKDEFVATLSHELRTPLTAILGWAQILRKPGNITPERLQKGLETIERNTRLQAQLVSDLLDMSRIVTGKIRLDVKPADLASVLEASLESVRHAAEAKHIRVRRSHVDTGGPVMVDPARIQQVIWNLLSNAIKFTPAGGQVDVSLSRTPSHVTIAIEDTGHGISQEFLPQLFGRFRQADSSATRKYGGLGLGLAIVKHIVELHGGRVRAESAGLGAGSRFVVELPLVTASQEADTPDTSHGSLHALPAATCTTPELAGVKVLVVEDEPDTRDLVKRLLEECHAEVTTAASAPEALGMLGRELPDVLVSDLGMPGMDGYALIRQIRTAQGVGSSELPALALTAFARPEDKERALSAGYEAHLAKPVEPSELVATVAGLSSLREKQRANGQSNVR